MFLLEEAYVYDEDFLHYFYQQVFDYDRALYVNFHFLYLDVEQLLDVLLKYVFSYYEQVMAI